MIIDVADMLRVRAADKGLQLLVDGSSEFPRYIVGDEAKLRQILVNLMADSGQSDGQRDQGHRGRRRDIASGCPGIDPLML